MYKRIIATVMTVFVLTFGFTIPADAGNPNVACQDGQTITDTSGRLHVHVGPGDTCTLDGANVFSVHSQAAANVYIYDTTVAHNINVTGTTGDTVIGTRGCKFDPSAGNNVQVKNSHNVLICFVHADNNIKVMRNDGRITVRDSVADAANILVFGNKHFVNDAGYKHKHPGTIRLLDNTAKNHIYAIHNGNRPIKDKGNSPAVVVK